MHVRNSSTTYGIITKLLHWIIIISFSTQYYLAFRREYFPEDSPLKLQYILLHKSIGVTLIGIGIIFALWALINKKPSYPSSMKRWEINLAKVTKYLLYFTIILMPCSGFVMSQTSNRTILWFGHPIPQLLNPNENLADLAYTIHIYLGYTAIAIIALHILGALKHLFTSNDHIVKRMLKLN